MRVCCPLPLVQGLQGQRIGDDRRGHFRTEPTREVQVSATDPRPLAALPLEPVDVDGNGRAPQPRDHQEWAIRGVHHDQNVGRVDERVQEGQKRVRERFRHPEIDQRQVDFLDSPIRGVRFITVASSAIHGDQMSPFHEASADFGGGGLEPTVEARDTPTAGESYVHLAEREVLTSATSGL